MDRLAGVLLKIERAKQHIADLDVAIRSFCNSDPYTLRIKEKPEIQHVALYVDSVSPLPDEIALIVGDAVHNLRSAFDHLAWQLVEAGGGTPNHHTYFPICETPHQFASAIGQGEINKMRAGANEVIEALQLYASGDRTIWNLNALDRIDKHRLVLTVTTFLNAWGINIEHLKQVIWFGERPVVLETGYEIVNVPALTYHRQGHKNFKLGLDVAFGQSEVVAGKPVLETLTGMADLVSSLMPQFQPFLL